MTKEKIEILRGTGNVYADFGDPDADTKLMKAYLAAEIIKALDRRRGNADEDARLEGVSAAELARIRGADLGRFTIDRLVRVLNQLDLRVSLKVTKARRDAAA